MSSLRIVRNRCHQSLCQRMCWRLMNDGTIAAIQMKIISQLKANEDLKSTTIKMVEQIKVLNTPRAERQTKRELFNALRQELEPSALEKASTPQSVS